MKKYDLILVSLYGIVIIAICIVLRVVYLDASERHHMISQLYQHKTISHIKIQSPQENHFNIGTQKELTKNGRNWGISGNTETKNLKQLRVSNDTLYIGTFESECYFFMSAMEDVTIDR